MDLDQRVDALLPLVSKPTRYLGNELNVVRKDPRPDMVQWCLVLPEVYEIGMSHLGLRVLYHILNSLPAALAERAYAPWFDMEAQMRRHGVPLFSLESRKPLRAFDVVGFSLQYELTYTNILNCLDLAGIPLRAEDRGDSDPLIAAGGPCASNPEPMSDFIDLFLIGDGEEAVGDITRVVQALRGRPRAEILGELAKLPGIYVPLLYRASYGEEGRFLGVRPASPGIPERVKKRFLINLENAPWPEKPIVPLQDIVQNRLSLEVLRGCTQGCRFCQAGYLYRPVRERSVARILELADLGIRNSGWDELGLVSLSTADYSRLESMADVLNARFVPDTVALSLPSLRADSFGIGVADRIRETRKTGFTFAPEAGSLRLRLALNKNIPDEGFFQAAHAAYSRGWRLIKMYFMIGLPTETWEDIEGIERFVDKVRSIGRSYGPSCAVHASVGAFVPKSHTPFQWDPFEGVAALREKLSFLQRRIPTRWSRLKWHPLTTSHLEAILSLGDRRLGKVIEHAFRQGARFDGWTEYFRYERWMGALQACGIDPDGVTRGRQLDESLPWDHIDIGISKKWLMRERRKTDEQDFEAGRPLTPDCRQGECTACGIPGMPDDTRLAPAVTAQERDHLIGHASSLAPLPLAGAITWPVRLRFDKRDRARFISHLEMTQIFGRAFRMARVPLAHSQGHHPHPRISFGPPLSVGIEGWGEGLDAELLQRWSTAVKESLNAALPEGLRVLDGVPLPTITGIRRLSLSAACRYGVYLIDLRDLDEEALASCRQIAESFIGLESCVVERSYWIPDGSPEVTDWEAAAQVDEAARAREDRPAESPSTAPGRPRDGRGGKQVRSVDLKQAVRRMGFVALGRAPHEDTDAPPPLPALLELELHLDHPQGHTANPRVVLERLFHLSPELQASVRIARTVLLDESGRPVLSST